MLLFIDIEDYLIKGAAAKNINRNVNNPIARNIIERVKNNINILGSLNKINDLPINVFKNLRQAAPYNFIRGNSLARHGISKEISL